MKLKFFNLTVLTIATVLLVPNVALAQNDGSKAALAKAQFMLRQASTEKAEVEKQLAAQKAETEKLSKEMAAFKNDSKNKVNASNTAQQELVEQAKGERTKVQGKLDNQIEKNTALQAENEILVKKLAAQTNNFNLCYGNNKKLFEINNEILGKYENKGFWAAMKQKESFTSIEKVKVENLIQDYQYEIDALVVKAPKDDVLVK